MRSSITHLCRCVLLGIALSSASLAQLTPNATYTPPPASSGLVSSNGSNPNTQWSTVLGNALYFYEAQRTGSLPITNRVPWRNSTSYLSDGADLGLNLLEGYFDAGDYILATFPLSWTISQVTWGALQFGKAYDVSGQTAYLDQMLRWGLDWCIKAHPEPNTVVFQVGSGEVDDVYWGGDLNIPHPRTSYLINSTHPGTDVAASLSAMFALASLLYSPTAGMNLTGAAKPSGMADQAYSDVLGRHAVELYGFAMNSTRVTFSESVPAAGAAYTSSSYNDDLALASLALSLSTSSSSYYTDAQTLISKNNLGASYSGVLNWDGKIPAVDLLGWQVSVARPAVVGRGEREVWAGRVEQWLDFVISGRGRGYFTDGGLYFLPGDSDEASLNPALNAASVAAMYAPFASSSGKGANYTAFAKSQLDYAMGKNPMNAVYMVGLHPNSAQNPHSAPASGGSNISNINTQPEKEAYVLYGAMVGGPDSSDNYYDLRDDYPQTEVALDYNAPILTLSAWQILTTTTDPFYTSLAEGTYQAPSGTPCDAVYPCTSGSGGLSLGGKIAIGVLVPLFVLGTVGGIFWWVLRR